MIQNVMINKSKAISILCASVATALIVTACSTARKKSEDGEPEESAGSVTPQDPVSAGISGDRRLVIQSLSRDPVMQHPVNRQKVEQLAAKLAPIVQSGKADRRVLEAYLSAQRLGNGSLPDQAGTARAVADLSMRKNVDFELSAPLRLELAISAVEVNRLALAEFLLDPLLNLKDGRVRAAAYNLAGVIAIKMDRVPEAVVAFQEALKSANDYRPARINLGMLALDGGDFALARSMLGGSGDNALVASGEVTLARFKDGAEQAAEICKSATAKFPDYKPLLFNCGLNDVQGRKNLARGKDYLARMLRAPGTDRRADRYDDRAQRLMMAIDAEAGATKAPESKSNEKSAGTGNPSGK